MKFLLMVQGGPYTHQASLSAWHFAKAALAAGHEIGRVFFYHDGVYNGSSIVTPPQDEMNLHAGWVQLANEHNLELIVCIASALRRGVLDAGEARRHDKIAAVLEPPFILSGLGQLIDGALTADRTVSFGP